jgi:hypothetical protein
MPLSEADQDAFVKKLVGNETAASGAVDYVSMHTSKHGELFTSLPNLSAARRQPRNTLRLVMISDTHERHRLLDMPPGDVLVHGGDILLFNSSYSHETSMRKLREFNDWLGTLPYREIVVVGGNHDFCLQALGKAAAKAVLFNCVYLENEFCVLGSSGLRVFGSPASVPNPLPAWRGGGVSNSPNRAFQYTSHPGKGYAGTEADLAEIFGAAPEQLDVLLVHGQIESMPAAQLYLQCHSPSLVVCGHVR